LEKWDPRKRCGTISSIWRVDGHLAVAIDIFRDIANLSANIFLPKFNGALGMMPLPVEWAHRSCRRIPFHQMEEASAGLAGSTRAQKFQQPPMTAVCS
jgi:hypothetical protein